MLAISSIPLVTSAKKGLEMSGITTPTVVVFLLANPLATAFGLYPNRSIVAKIFFLVSGLTLVLPLTTLETVAME